MSNVTIYQKRVARLKQELAQAEETLHNVRLDQYHGRPGSMRRAVWDLLQGTQLTTRQIALELKFNINVVVNRMTELENRKCIKRIGLAKSKHKGREPIIWTGIPEAEIPLV